MTLLKLPLPKIVMVSVLPDLTRGITNPKAMGSHSRNLENLLIRNPRGLIRSPTSLRKMNINLNTKPLSITKKPFAISMA